MKNYLSKSFRVEETLSPEAKKTKLILDIASAVLFVCGSFAIFEFIYILCNLIGAIVSASPYEMAHELSRMFPTMLSLGNVIHLGFLVHVLTRSHSQKKRGRVIVANGFALAIMGGISVLYFLIGLFTKTYDSLVEGYPTLLYPLDNIFLSLCIIGIGVGLILKKQWIIDRLSMLPYRENDTRLAVTRVFDYIFGGIAYFCALFAMAALLYGIVVIDRSHGHGFYILGLHLIFLATIFMFVQFKYVYCALKENVKKEYVFKAALITLGINVICYVIYFIAISLDPEAPGQVAYGILPIEFTASVNVVTLLYPIVLIVTPLVAVIKSLIHKNK